MAKAARRRSVVQRHGPTPLYVIAGLPLAAHRRTLQHLSDRFPTRLFKGVSSPANDGGLYGEALVATLMRGVGSFVVRRRNNDPAQPTPRSLTLLYVPAPDEQRLLRAFEFSAMTIPLPALAALDERYRQLRHDPNAVIAAIEDAIAPGAPAQQALAEVSRRLNFKSDNEALLLPPRNFLVGDGDLVPTFREFGTGQRAWTDRLAELGPCELTHEDVPKRVAHQQTRRVFVDRRGVAFFMAHPQAFDGPPREVEDDSETEIASALRSLYRFGGALDLGIHHDAQRSDGSPLQGAVFHCDERGRIRANDDYANVYPNDFVRVADYERDEP